MAPLGILQGVGHALGVVLGPYAEVVRLVIDLPDDVMRRLESVAATQGVRVEDLAARVLVELALLEPEFAATVKQTIEDHRQTLDRLAES